MASEAKDNEDVAAAIHAGEAEANRDIMEIPAAALQSEGGQRLEPMAPGDVPPGGRPLIEVLGERFDAWFDGFNDDHENAPARAHAGTVSWKQAQEAISRALVDYPELAVGGIIGECLCTGRHMHSQPFSLPVGWMFSTDFVMKGGQFRARRAADPEMPTSDFAVQVNETDLATVIASRIEDLVGPAQPATPQPEDLAPPPAQPTAPPPGEDAAYMRMASRSTRFDETVVPSRHVFEEAVLPDGYRLLRTSDGIVVAWYGRPRATQAEAVADAWRREMETKR